MADADEKKPVVHAEVSLSQYVHRECRWLCDCRALNPASVAQKFIVKLTTADDKDGIQFQVRMKLE